MVFGWGKKKKSLEFETTIPEEREIKCVQICFSSTLVSLTEFFSKI